MSKKQTSLLNLWGNSAKKKTPSRNNSQRTLSPEQKARIQRNKEEAKRRLKNNGGNLSNHRVNSSPNSSTHSSLTPAINRVKMTTNEENESLLANRSSKRKRNRAQYKEADSDNSPIQPRSKKRRIKKTQIESDEDFDPMNEQQIESESEYQSSASPQRQNRNNHNNNSKIFVDDNDTLSPMDDLNQTNDEHLDKMAMFGHIDEDDEDFETRKPIKRDAQYQYKNYADYKRKLDARYNSANLLSTGKGGGASHKDVSQQKWYKYPRDHSGRTPDDPNYNKSQILVPAAAYKTMTPSQQQYWKYKKDHYDGILCFKVGKFYELYGRDADIAHKILGLKYMGGGMPHCGFPEKSFHKYAESFVSFGLKVFRVEQMEDSKVANKRKGKEKLVKREICEVLTRGTLIDEELLDERANFILSVVDIVDNAATSQIDVGICFMDYSTGKIQIGRFKDDRNRSRLRTLIFQLNPRECVYKKNEISKATLSLLKNEAKSAICSALIVGEEFYDCDKTRNILQEEAYWSEGFDAFPNALKLAWDHNITLNAIGGILYTLQHTMHDHEILPHSRWRIYDPTSATCNDYLTLDGSTLGNLEILTNEEGTKRGTLIEFVDKCRTKFGKRQMENWLKMPLNKLEAINERLDAVAYLIEEENIWMNEIGIQSTLSGLADLERILHHLAVLGTKGRKMDRAVLFEKCWNKAKVIKLMDALKGFEEIENMLILIDNHRNNISSKLINDITTIIGPNDGDFEEKNERNIPEFGSWIKTFKASFEINDDDLIKPAPGKNTPFDENDYNLRQNTSKLDGIEQRLRQKYQCSKIKFHKKTGTKIKETYQIEIPKKAHIEIPDEWHEIGTGTKTVNRYHSDEILELLEERERLFDEKEELIRDAARATFEKFAANGHVWRKVVENIATLDCLLSLSLVSNTQMSEFEMTRPIFKKSNVPFLEIRGCRHPCIDESYLNGLNDGSTTFIPNDTVLGCKENECNFVVVTGPNMGGKSTLLRQTCIAVILAHIGCYVPCTQMILSPVDRIFTRVGANDRILAGQSTFMVELEETSNILTHCTKNSLVILDELGRGTSTFDGTAIAHAVAESLMNDIGCRCLFSTHYHGLCEAFAQNDKVAMYHMAYQEINDKITFLYQFTKGICTQSHGINCAKLAGLPDFICNRAQQRADMLHDRMHSEDPNQLKNEQGLEKEFCGLLDLLDLDDDGKIVQKLAANQKEQ